MAICDHLDLLKSVGDVPDELILPILNRCTPEQLLVVETHTERRLPTAGMWQRHCERLGLREEEREHNGRKISWKQVWKNEQKRIEERKEQVGLRLRNMYKQENEAKKHRATKHISAAAPRTRAASSFGKRTGSGPVFAPPPATARARLAKKIGASTKSVQPPIISPVVRKQQLLAGSAGVARSTPVSSARGPSTGATALSKPSHSSPSYSSSSSLPSISRRPLSRSSSSSSSSPSPSRTPMSTTVRTGPPLLPVVGPAKRKKKELDLPSFTKIRRQK